MLTFTLMAVAVAMVVIALMGQGAMGAMAEIVLLVTEAMEAMVETANGAKVGMVATEEMALLEVAKVVLEAKGLEGMGIMEVTEIKDKGA